MDFAGFVSELRRRKVVRLAVIYVIVAVGVIQAADAIFPALDIPEWGVSLVVVLVILGFPIAVVLSWMFDATSRGVRKAGGGGTVTADSPPRRAADGDGADGSRVEATSHTTTERSIAVLPFVDLSEEGDNEFFSDGVTEEILNALTRLRELRVASRTSSFTFKRKDVDVRQIAESLNVATVLEGSVRKAGNRLRITAQLINASDGYHLWSQTFDRELEDVFEVQDEIARSIADALKVELDVHGSRQLVAGATENLEAYTLYLKGRYVYNKFRRADLRKSMHFYDQALGKDPRYARAYAGMADSWMSLADDWLPPEEAYPKAKESALKALALDDTLAEAHTALGKVLGWFDWDFDAGELALRRAAANNPSYAEGHYGLGSVLPPNGKLEEGLTEIRTAVALDPLSCEFSAWAARFLLYLRRYDEAIDACLQTIELDPTYYYAFIRLGNTYLAMGRYEDALAAFQNDATRVTGVLSVRAYEAEALAALGETERARGLLAEIGSDPEGHYVRNEFLAGAYASLGDPDRAFKELEKAYAARSAGLIYLHLDPMYDPLREDPRYAALVDRIGLKSG